MKVYTIYKVKNLSNGKIYIGFTQNFEKRKKEHISLASKPNHKNKSLLHYAIQKYGVKNFKWDIIYQSKELDHTKNIMENHFISEYNSFAGFGFGYNVTFGGEGSHGRSFSEDSINKMIKSINIFYRNPENIKKHQQTMLMWWENLPDVMKKQFSDRLLNKTIVKDILTEKIIGFVPIDHENIKKGIWVGINKGFKHSDSTKKQMSIKKKGKNPYKRTKETNLNISIGRKGKGLGKNNAMSIEENRNKVRDSKLGRRKYIDPISEKFKYCLPGNEPEGFILLSDFKGGI